MNVAPQKYDFINLNDLQNLSKRFLNNSDHNNSKVNLSQFNELYEANKTDTIYITEADIKEYNKHLAIQKAKGDFKRLRAKFNKQQQQNLLRRTF